MARPRSQTDLSWKIRPLLHSVTARWIGLVPFISLAGVAGGGSCAIADIPEWFRDQYVEAAARLESPLRNLRCRFEASGEDQSGKFGYTGEFFCKNASVEAVRIGQTRSVGARDVAATVICLTDQRFFQLEKPTGGESYVVRGLVVPRDAKQRERYEAVAFFAARAFLEATFRMDDPVKTLLAAEAVRDVQVAKVRRKGREFVELRCTFSEAWNYERAKATLDPEMDLAVCDYEIAIRADPGTVSTRKGFVECKRWGATRFVFPERVRIEDDTRTAGGERYFKIQEMTFEDVRLNEVQDSQFSMTAFGLPEISLTPRGRYYPFDRWYFWLPVSMGLFGWILRRIGERRLRARS